MIGEPSGVSTQQSSSAETFKPQRLDLEKPLDLPFINNPNLVADYCPSPSLLRIQKSVPSIRRDSLLEKRMRQTQFMMEDIGTPSLENNVLDAIALNSTKQDE